MASFLLVGQGGFGDMIPLYALARGLKQRGHDIRIAAQEHQRSACEAADLSFVALPSTAPLGVRAKEVTRLWNTLSPEQFEAEYTALLPLVDGVDGVIGNQLAYAAALASRVVGRRWVFSAASPLVIPSIRDAPYWPYLYPWQKRAARLGLPQRLFLPAARLATRVVMQSQVRLYRRLGVPLTGHPRFEAMYSSALNLLMTSPELAPAQPDWPAHTVATGFAWYDPPFLGGSDQEQTIVEFAAAGPAPIVFAPGGSTRVEPGAFFEQSVAAAQMSGRRAIIVAAKKFHGRLASSPQVLVTGYFPYARLFRHASLVVHSGGIGALGWAARYGVPSLLVPTEWDQFDNARRAERAGLGRVLDIRRYTAANIVAAIRALENDTHVAAALARLAPLLSAEDGERVASEAVAALLS
jgi:UDP:flavonoid glycosyltransferase YjiC (YdhE family)